MSQIRGRYDPLASDIRVEVPFPFCPMLQCPPSRAKRFLMRSRAFIRRLGTLSSSRESLKAVPCLQPLCTAGLPHWPQSTSIASFAPVSNIATFSIFASDDHKTSLYSSINVVGSYSPLPFRRVNFPLLTARVEIVLRGMTSRVGGHGQGRKKPVVAKASKMVVKKV